MTIPGAAGPGKAGTARALGAITAQGVQAGISFVLQVLVARWLGIEELGRFAILYGLIVVATAVVTGFVGDSLVVLDRGNARIRGALQGWGLALIVVAAVATALAVALIGLVSPIEALAFAAALAVFVVEELLRRLLMVSLTFFRVAIADLSGFAIALAIVWSVEATSGATLITFLLAIAAGQLVGAVVAISLLPRHERRVASLGVGGYREVARYGSWRGLQQLLRPALLTVVRLGVGVVAGLAAVGLLEAARVYIAPAMLLIGGLTSYLFVDYARQSELGMPDRLRRADRAVLRLVAGTVVIGIVALALAGWAGPFLFGVALDPIAVVGWIAYATSVAAVTPYGSLAAVVGRQSRVFAIRAGDTVLSALAVVVALSWAMEPSFAPLLLAGGSLIGGLAIRFGVLAPLRSRSIQGRPNGSSATDPATDDDVGPSALDPS